MKRRNTEELVQELIPLVKEETDKIKRFATEEEIAKLDEKKVNGSSRKSCVYGLMTGHCNSPRALELIALCCERVYVGNGSGTIDTLNGHPSEIEVKDPMNLYFGRDGLYLSPIEQIIFPDNLGIPAGKRIIQYIKGNTPELKLDDLELEPDEIVTEPESQDL